VVALTALTLTTIGCSYQTVKPNEVGVKLYDGKFSEPVPPGRHPTSVAPWHEVEIVTWRSGVAQSVFTKSKNNGDRPGDDSIRVSSLEGAVIDLDVTVLYRIDTSDDQVRCLYRAGYITNEAIRDRLIRPNVQAAFGSIAGFVGAKDIQTVRKGELANVVLVYLQESMGQTKIPPTEIRSIPEPVINPERRIAQTHPDRVIPKTTSCGIAIENVLIPQVALPKNIQEAVNAAIKAEADAQRITVEQKSATAEAERIRIEAEGEAAKTRIAASAQAQANAEISASMSPGLIQLRATEACARALEKTQAKVASCGGGGTGISSNNIVIPAG
jgi:regulator of protease activity HflC (stomatin/prohibitin superfamily)